MGITTAALAAGGAAPSPSALVEQWNGTNWTEVGDLNQTRRGLGSSGSSPSSLAVVGS